MAFHPKLNNGASETEDGLKHYFKWLSEGTTSWEVIKKIAYIVIGMSVLLLVISKINSVAGPANPGSSPQFRLPLFKILIFYNTMMASSFLSRYLFELLELKSTFLKACLGAAMFLAANAWALNANWLTIDLAAGLMGVMLLMQFRSVSFRATAIISIAIMIYDAVMVFGTGTMQKAASGFLELPVLFKIPGSLSLTDKPLMHMGLGDIVLPGVIIMMAMRNSLKHKNFNLAGSAMAGYVVGFIITTLVMAIFQFPQPATIYLIPCTQFGFIFSAWKNGLWKEVS